MFLGMPSYHLAKFSWWINTLHYFRILANSYEILFTKILISILKGKEQLRVSKLSSRKIARKFIVTFNFFLRLRLLIFLGDSISLLSLCMGMVVLRKPWKVYLQSLLVTTLIYYCR